MTDNYEFVIYYSTVDNLFKLMSWVDMKDGKSFLKYC
jgi:hypothetical protein